MDYEGEAGEHEINVMARINKEDPINCNLDGDYFMTSRQYLTRRGPVTINTTAKNRESGHVEL